MANASVANVLTGQRFDNCSLPHPCLRARAEMDSDLLMKSLNPELYALMVRVKAIHAICGGDTGIKVDKKTMKAFDYKKTMCVGGDKEKG